MSSPYRQNDDVTAHELGAFRSAHAERSGCVLGGIVALLTVGVLFVFAKAGINEATAEMMGAVILVGLAVLWWVAKRNRRDVILLHDRGIVSEKNGRPTVIRFDDVKSITSSKQRQRNAGIEAQKHIVLANDGTSIAFSLFFDGALDLLAAVDAATHERIYAESLKAFDSGEIVNFGPISISEDGFFDSKRAVVPWSEIDRAAIEMPLMAMGPMQAELNVWKRGERHPSAKYATERVPNASVLIEMIDLAVQAEDEEIAQAEEEEEEKEAEV